MIEKNLFTAKSIESDEWIEGFYGNGLIDIKPDKYRHFIIKWNVDLVRGYFNDIEVIPETVSQFTGKTLIKGNKIFEGTIAFFEEENEDGSDSRTYVVCTYIEEWCMFAWLTGAERLLYECGGIRNLDIESYWTFPIENSEKYHYAGHIYDNENLLSD